MRDGHLRILRRQCGVRAGGHHAPHAGGIALRHQQAVAVVHGLAVGVESEEGCTPSLLHAAIVPMPAGVTGPPASRTMWKSLSK